MIYPRLRIAQLEKKWFGRAQSFDTPEAQKGLDTLLSLYLKTGLMNRAEQLSEDLVAMTEGRKDRPRDPRNAPVDEFRTNHKLRSAVFSRLRLLAGLYLVTFVAALLFLPEMLVSIGQDWEDEYPQAAMVCASIALCLKEQSADAHFLKGYLIHNQDNPTKKDYNAAIDEYSRVLSLDPDFGCAYNNRGICYQMLAEGEKGELSRRLKNMAYRDVRASVAVHKDDYNHHSSLGWILQEQNQHKAAIDSFKTALSLLDADSDRSVEEAARARVDILDRRASSYRELHLDKLAEQDEKASARLSKQFHVE